MKVDLSKFDFIKKDGEILYPVDDIVREIIPGYNWEEIDRYEVNIVTVEIDSIKKPYSDIDGITKLLERSKPPVSGFDALLKGIMNIPKK